MRQRSTLLTWEWFSFCPNGDLKSQNYHFPDMYLLLSHCPCAGRTVLDTGKGDYGLHCFTNFNFEPLSVCLFFRVFSILQHSAPVACNEHLPFSQMRSQVITIRHPPQKKRRGFLCHSVWFKWLVQYPNTETLQQRQGYNQRMYLQLQANLRQTVRLQMPIQWVASILGTEWGKGPVEKGGCD